MGASALFMPVASIVNIVARNPMVPVRIESIDADVEIDAGRTVAIIESVRLASDRVEPGQTLRAFVTLKPFKGDRATVELDLPLPAELDDGPYEATVCDMPNSLRRRFRNEPCCWSLARPRRPAPGAPTPDRAEADRDHAPRPDAGTRPGRSWPVAPNLPGVSVPSSPPVARAPSHRSGPTSSGRSTPPGSSRGTRPFASTWSRTPGSRRTPPNDAGGRDRTRFNTKAQRTQRREGQERRIVSVGHWPALLLRPAPSSIRYSHLLCVLRAFVVNRFVTSGRSS